MKENEKTGTVGQTSDPINQPHTIEEVAPSSVPLTIPYFEVYRTNELEYVEYQSPFLNQSSESEGDGDSESEDMEDSETVKEKKKKLWTALSEIVWKNFPKLQGKDYMIQDLRSADLDWTSVAKVVNSYSNKYKSKYGVKISGDQQDRIIEAVIKEKEKASGTTRRTYSQSKKIIKAGKRLINTKKGQVLVNTLNNYNQHDGNDAFAHFLGSKIETISKMKLK